MGGNIWTIISLESGAASLISRPNKYGNIGLSIVRDNLDACLNVQSDKPQRSRIYDIVLSLLCNIDALVCATASQLRASVTFLNLPVRLRLFAGAISLDGEETDCQPNHE